MANASSRPFRLAAMPCPKALAFGRPQHDRAVGAAELVQEQPLHRGDAQLPRAVPAVHGRVVAAHDVAELHRARGQVLDLVGGCGLGTVAEHRQLERRRLHDDEAGTLDRGQARGLGERRAGGARLHLAAEPGHARRRLGGLVPQHGQQRGPDAGAAVVPGDLDVRPEPFRVQRGLVDHAGRHRDGDAVHDVLGHDAAAPRGVARGRQRAAELSGLDGLRAAPDFQQREVVALAPFPVFDGHGQAPISRAAR